MMGTLITIPISKEEVTKLRQEWRTPQHIFDLFDAEFAFDVDVAASCDNHKCPVFIDEDSDALSPDACWFNNYTATEEDVFASMSAYCNPPFNNMSPWIEKAHTETEGQAGSVAVILCNYDPSTAWFMRARALCYEIRVLAGQRVQFDPPPGIRQSSNSKAQALLIFRKHPESLTCVERSWEWTA